MSVEKILQKYLFYQHLTPTVYISLKDSNTDFLGFFSKRLAKTIILIQTSAINCK